MSTKKEDNDDIPFGQRIKNMRTASGITQDKLAKILDISKDYVSRMEKGERTPSIHLKKAIEKLMADQSSLRDAEAGKERVSEIFTEEQTKEESVPMVRNYRDLALMDADTLGEIQTRINDMERFRPGFTSWFRLEFQNRFPEFDDWKNRLVKKRTGTGN